MDSQLNQVEDYLNNQVAGRLTAQWRQVKREWEPKLVQTLGGVAELCMQALAEGLKGYFADQPQRISLGMLQLQMGLEFEAIVQQRLEETKELLREFVQSEMAGRQEILSLNGFASGADGPPAITPDPAQSIDRLAGIDVMERSLAKSFQMFKRRVFDDIYQAVSGDLTSRALNQRLLLASRWWCSHLQTNARTVLYSAAAHARRALDQEQAASLH
jgi:hypothetical protein